MSYRQSAGSSGFGAQIASITRLALCAGCLVFIPGPLPALDFLPGAMDERSSQTVFITFQDLVDGPGARSPIDMIAAQDEPMFERVPPAGNPDPFGPITPPVPPGPPGPGPAARPGEPVRYGQEPVDYTEQFLRTESVLLKPGDWQFDAGINYMLLQGHFPAIIGSDLVRADIRQRNVFVPLGARYGLTERVQLFGTIPVGWAEAQINAGGHRVLRNRAGSGDITLGFNYLLQRGDLHHPDVIFTVGGNIPTHNPVPPFFINQANLGSGLWSINANLLFVHRYDPVVVFWGGGYGHQFATTWEGARLQPGEEFNYQLGVGFAVNDRTTLSTALLGAYITRARYDGVTLHGTDLEPIRMRFALTAVRRCGTIIEPFAEIGMTDEAPMRLGIVWTW